MCRPTDVEPTNDTPLMSGCVRRVSASCREEVTGFRTPFGRHASFHKSIIRMEVRGTKLAALMTMVLPVAMHNGALQPIGIMAGKFHGAIPAKTPRGPRYCVVS